MDKIDSKGWNIYLWLMYWKNKGMHKGLLIGDKPWSYRLEQYFKSLRIER